MPLALEPGAHFKVVLKSDEHKPAKERPFFLFRYLTGRAWNKIASMVDLRDRLDKNNVDSAFITEETYDTIRRSLVGWGNMAGPDKKKIPYDPKMLEDVVGMVEAQELIVKMLNQGLEIDVKKKSDSPSRSSTKRSVKRAKVKKPAKTRRQSANH